jgi:propanediol dehydratase small subunit
MTTTKHGQASGKDTTKNDNGLTTPHSQPVKTINTNALNFIALRQRLQRAVNGFRIDGAICADTILLAVLMAAYLMCRAV